MRRRRAEERDHGIADELLDGAPVALELVPGAAVILREQRFDVLRVAAVGAAREPDEIREENGQDLALLPWLDSRQRCTARLTEPCDGRVLLAAATADRHAPKPKL